MNEGQKTTLQFIGAGLLMAVVICGIFFVLMYFTNPVEIQFDVSSVYYDLDYATCPYGILWIQEKGEIRGGGFIFVSIEGKWSTELVETYIVKYWKDDMLHSTTFYADEVPIVFDGTFRLEQQTRAIIETYRDGQVNIIDEPHARCPSYWGWCQDNGIVLGHSYIIHLPQKPIPDQTITVELTIFGD